MKGFFGYLGLVVAWQPWLDKFKIKNNANGKRRATAVFLVWWNELFGYGIILYYFCIWADPFVPQTTNKEWIRLPCMFQVSLGKLVLSACSIDIAIQSCLTIIMVLLVQAANQGRVADPNITKYSVKVLPVSTGSCLSFTGLIIWLVLIIDSLSALSCSSRITVTECSQICMICLLETICY